jgi:plasmid stabilization system protein ParE
MTPEDDTLGSYEILFSEPAEAELEAEYLRLAGVRFEIAERWNESILTACQSLSQLPKRHPLAPNQVQGGYQTRRMPFRIGSSGYSILYAVFDPAEDDAGFVRILHIRRN